MKKLFLISIVLFGINHIMAQIKNEIKLIATHLHSEHYHENEYPKEILKAYVISDTEFSQFPEAIASYEFSPTKKDKNYFLECELRADNIKKEMKEQSFDPLQLNTTFKGCYAKYIQTAAEIRFAFELQNNTVIYHINQVYVYIYYTKTPLSSDKNFFKHKEDEREKLFLDITQLNKLQRINLSQPYPLKDGGLALKLRLFPSKYWQGTFEKTRVLLKIGFKFSNGQLIYSKPFLVDI